MHIHWVQAESQLICLQGIAEEDTMNNAHNQTTAVSRTSGCGALVRLVRRGAAVIALACVAIGPAAAQHRRDDGQPAPRSERFQLPRDMDNRGDPRASEQRPPDQRAPDQRAFDVRDEQRRQAQMQQEQNLRNAENLRRSGRMTPDERRDLRRQINEAGMDLYPTPQRR
jgi:hypothetical protein